MVAKKLRICVMGLGNIGLPVAIYVHKFFEDTIGYDISPKAVVRAINNGVDAYAFPQRADVYVVCVNTFFRDNAPDITAIDSCCRQISALNNKALVCFESTLPVGTAVKMALKYNLRYVAVCPHRWWEEDQEKYGVKQLRVLGTYDMETMKKARAFYDKLEIPLHLVSSLEVAEASKIAENAHRYVQIAFVEELKLIAYRNGLNFDELREAVNTKWNVNLMEARDGIGKECLPKDTAFLALLSPEPGLLAGAIQTNENYVQCFVKQKQTLNKQAPMMPLATKKYMS